MHKSMIVFVALVGTASAAAEAGRSPAPNRTWTETIIHDARCHLQAMVHRTSRGEVERAMAASLRDADNTDLAGDETSPERLARAVVDYAMAEPDCTGAPIS